jgi:hypothetical protein
MKTIILNRLTSVYAICEHCGKNQRATEVNYSLTYVKCKYCKKEGTLREIKSILDEIM